MFFLPEVFVQDILSNDAIYYSVRPNCMTDNTYRVFFMYYIKFSLFIISKQS